jgi:hypothetical protein
MTELKKRSANYSNLPWTGTYKIVLVCDRLAAGH